MWEYWELKIDFAQGQKEISKVCSFLQVSLRLQLPWWLSAAAGAGGLGSNPSSSGRESLVKFVPNQSMEINPTSNREQLKRTGFSIGHTY